MTRLPALFAMFAVVLLVLGLFPTDPSMTAGMTFTSPARTFVIPNRLLCFAAALSFCFFATAYSAWFVPWSYRSGLWHFGLSAAAVGAFVLSSVAFRSAGAFDQKGTLTLPLLLAFSLSPFVFLLVQGVFFFDGLRRCWPLLRRMVS